MRKLTIVLLLATFLLFYFTSKSKYEYAKTIEVDKVNIQEDLKYEPTYYNEVLKGDIAIHINETLKSEEIYVEIAFVNVATNEVLSKTDSIFLTGTDNVYTLRYNLASDYMCLSDTLSIDIINFENEVMETVIISDYITQEFCID